MIDKQKKEIKFNHAFYITLICLYTFFRILSSSYSNTFLAISLNFWIEFINYLCCGGLILLFFIQKKISVKKLLLVIIFTIIVGAICIKVFDRPFFISYLFIICYPPGLSMNNTCKKLFKSYALATIYIILLATLGIIENSTLYQHGNIRYSLGFVSPNTFSSIITLALMIWIYYKSDDWKFRYNIPWIMILLVVYYFSRSRLALIIGISDLLLTSLAFRKKTKKRLNNTIFNLSKYLPIILSAVCIILTLYYSNHSNNFYNQLNNIFTGRLSWMIYYYKEYGFHLIGQPIITVSRREALQTGITWSNIDNAYVFFAVKYGILLLIGLIILYYALGKYLKNKDNLKGAVYVILIFIVGLTENFLLATGYNISLLLIAEMINNTKLKQIIEY